MQKAKAGYRVSTGPVQFDNDWPGYFMRGDELLVGLLDYVADQLDDAVLADRLRREAEKMRECLVH